MSDTPGIRERVKAASSRLKRLRRVDRAAAAIITLGGVGIVASVIGILVFVLSEAWPLFRPAEGHLAGTVTLATPKPGRVLVSGTDEYQAFVYQVRDDARLELFKLSDGVFVRELILPGLDGATLTAASRTLTDDLAVATSDGRVALFEVGFRPRYENQKRVDLEVTVNEKGLLDLDPGRRALAAVSYTEEPDGTRSVAGLVAAGEIQLLRVSESGEERATLRLPTGERVSALRMGESQRLIAGTDQGNVYHWQLGGAPRLTAISPVGAPVSALTWILGGITFVAGTERGEISAWFPVRLQEDDTETAIVRAHTFVPQGAPVVALNASTRDKSFVSAGADGSVALHYLTNERRILAFATGLPATELLLTPRNDAVLVLQQGAQLSRYDVESPHPEITWRALFGKTWYEGYAQPEYVWQSTGGTNDFETKFSLVPLVFGTLKGTFYALLFAIPLSIMGALYTSQFVHPSIRGKIKPTLEIMAALPSVVIGFVAGLWLASIVELWIVPVLLMTVLLPLCGTLGFLIWQRFPQALARKLKPGMELALIVPLLLLGGFIAVQIGPFVEGALFQGDFKLWLSSTLGITYDQRNSLVVGLAMGFAVIPIIFTIADDAFSSVPQSLSAGSLALGASRWQTALRVVLPTASPGVFSAVMIGFGRAVGETMIVLMATGNTPVLDWSIFNGMRTLSANVAVEIPEAPHGDSLYRTLFLSAALLFTMTFIVNTVAEVIRQRLRERYRAL